MKCTRCGKDLDDDRVFCSDCEKILKSESSRSELRELEDAIEDNKLLNDEENTKELFNIDDLDENFNIEENNDIKEDFTNNDQEPVLETREEKFKPKKNNKKKIIIIISSIVVLIIIIALIILFTNKKEKVEEIKIDYEKVLNTYGKKIEKEIKDAEEIPTYEELINKIEYEYKVECKVHEIYESRKVYLDKCIIDNKKIKYSYGHKEEEKEKTKLTIYKNNNIYNLDNGDLIGTITCEDEKCEFMTGFDKYAIVKENNLYNLYEYDKEEKVFGPFNDMSNIMYTENTLYAIYYTEGNNKNIYSLVSNRLYENINGRLILEEENFDPTLMYKYGYCILKDDNYNFFNLKSGKVSFLVEDKILKFEEDKSNNIMYILTYKNDANSFKVINSNGKKLFDGEINYFKLKDDEIVVGNNTQFKIYDKKLTEKIVSKKYDSVISIYDDCAIVMDNSMIKLVDLEDNLLSSFELEEKGEVDKEKTGWKTVDGKTQMYIYFKNSSKILIYDAKEGEMKYQELN